MEGIANVYGETITVVQLLYVRATADQGSFSKAAMSLGVTQPALSNGVAVLERAVGGELFERSRTGASLTPLGQRVLPHFLRILGSIESVAAEVRFANADVVALRVGVSPLIHPRVIAHALEAASRNGLGSLVLREDNLVPLREALVGRRLDLVLVPEVLDLSQFAHRTLESEPLHYMTADLNVGSIEQGVELSTLAANPLVMVGDSCGLTTVTSTLFANSGQTLRRYPGEADSYSTLQDWAALGLGGVVLPKSKFRSDVPTRAIVENGAPVLISYEAVWDPNSAQNATIGALLDAML